LNFKKLTPLIIVHLSVTLLFALSGIAQTAAPAQTEPQVSRPAVHSHRPLVREAETTPALCASCVQGNLSYLAGPALQGRGSGTEDEHRAAQFIAGKLKSYGLAPAAGDGQFIQTGILRSREVIGNPTLTIEPKSDGTAKPLVLTHGKQIAFTGLSGVPLSAPLQKLDLSGENHVTPNVVPASAVVVKVRSGITLEVARQVLEPYRSGKAALVIVESSPAWQHVFDMLAKDPPLVTEPIGKKDKEGQTRVPLVLTKPESFDQLWSEPEGSMVQLQAKLTPRKTTNTWNVLGKIEGTTEKDQVILLTAHLDHLGIVGGKTYPGADDDASGTAAVMELGRVLAREPKPKRTVIVALWGGEEKGLLGSRYFLQNPTFRLKDIVANLEFEMIGRPDPQLKSDELWLTGWDRTNLGPELAQQGAKLVADPRPTQRFFMRSDNYALAQDGIVAQTISSFGLHKDYHQTTDTLDKINFQHMEQAIASMIGPVTWLANTDFKPEWVEGKKP
jgi:peptidase M28-like protein